MKKLSSALLFGLALLSQSAGAKVTLPNHFTSNMVLQQQTSMKIHGTANPGSTVTLTTEWNKKGFSTQASSDGSFTLEVSTPKAGGPYTLTFSDGEQTTLDNVLIGEVWLGSGQSNMEMPVSGWGKILNYEEEIKNANYPQIRLLQVKKLVNIKPQDQVQLNMGGWQECSPKYIGEFSALCYFFALRLWEELKVPIGIIDDDWGGTPCESWVSAEALQHVTGFEKDCKKYVELGYDEKKILNYIDERDADYNKLIHDTDAGTSAGHAPWYDLSTADNGWKTMKIPTNWEQTEVGSIDGVLWFRRTIDIPANWAGKDVTFSMGNIDDEDISYWNGQEIGRTKTFSDKTLYTVPGSMVKAGKTQICIRVMDTGGNGGLSDAAEKMYVEQGSERISLTGDWKYNIGLNTNQVPARPLPLSSQNHPTVLYNAMIAPLIEFPVKGFIWYQGCSNVGRDQQHEVLFQTLINDWRNRWKNPNLPFYFVQLANYLQPSDLQPKSEWAKLRESQERALCLPNTGMAVNIDLGTAGDIHPKTKRELGRRLSAIALHNTYGKKNYYTAPTYKDYTVEGNEVHIHFDVVNGGESLVQEENLKGFIMAGADRVWHVATAKTNGNEVIVTCPEVAVPMAVRYGWADNPTCTLRTPSNLHVAPFRTDKW